MNPAASSVGAWLRAAREAAGLSEDAVAQQLKLHPRQVRAIEEDDFARLPGRTFVRGFVRNYARLVNLDADAVVAALPTGESTSPLERLTYTPSSRPMGEIPLESPRRRGGGAARWLIPLVLLGAVAVAAYFEFARAPAPRPATPDGIMPPPAPKAPTPSGPAVTPLPNPLDAPKSEAAAPAVAAAESAPAPAPATAAPASPATTQPQSAATVPSATTSATSAASPAATPAPGAMPAASAAPVVATTAPAPSPTRTEAAGDSTLVLTFIGTSWVRVKDASDNVLLSQTGIAGATLPVGGRPPLDVVIGNADKVRAQFRGQPVDLAPHTRFNVARLVLQ